MNGLRERKKAATRQAISDIATRMFEQRGFEKVTIAEIAEAADVSPKTIFNYFHSKEELFFDREDELLQGLLTPLREREPGVSATEAMRPLMLDGPILLTGCRWSDLQTGLYEMIRKFLECEQASPALTARRFIITQSWVEPLAEASGSETWAAMFVGILNLRQQAFGSAVLENRAPKTVERRVRSVVGEALDALERAFPA